MDLNCSGAVLLGFGLAYGASLKDPGVKLEAGNGNWRFTNSRIQGKEGEKHDEDG